MEVREPGQRPGLTDVDTGWVPYLLMGQMSGSWVGHWGFIGALPTADYCEQINS